MKNNGKVSEEFQKMSMRTDSVFPFSVVVGQEPMKMALLLNAVNPKIGGVLIRGDKGKAKSMVVRSLVLLKRKEMVFQW